MKNTLIKSLVALVMTAVMTLSAANYTLRLEQEGAVVPEITGQNKAVIKVYGTFGEDVQTLKFTFDFSTATGFSFDAENSSFSDKVIAGKTTVAPSGNAALFTVTGQQAVASVKATDTEILLATATFTVDPATCVLGSSAKLPFTVKSMLGTSGSQLTCDTLPEKIEIPIYEAFNFATKEGVFASTDEDVKLKLEATNTDYFECTAWNGTTLETSTEVVFYAASVDTVNGAVVGTAKIDENGAIVFTPAENWYGETVINYTAKSTKEGVSATMDGSIKVTVNSVYDAPVVTVIESECDLQFKEGQTFGSVEDTTNLKISVVDVDGYGLMKAATLSNDEYEYTLNVKLDVSATSNPTIYTVYFGDITKTLPYTAVKHPKTEESTTFTLTVVPNLQGAAAISVGDIPAKFIDVDRPVEITEFVPVIVSGDATPQGYLGGKQVYANAVINYDVVKASDPDVEDKVTTGYYSDPDPIVMKKDNSFKVWPWASSDFDGKTVVPENLAAFTTNFAVVNSAPVADPLVYSLFIQKQEGQAGGNKELTLTATDVDDGDVLAARQTLGPIGWDVSIDGLKVTFKTKSDVELEDQIFTFVVGDGETESEAITVTVDFMENPAPVVEITEIAAVSEVDGDGKPTVFEVTAKATDDKVYPAGVKEWKIEVPEGWTSELVSGATGSVTEGTWSGTATFKVTTKGYYTIVNPDSIIGPVISDNVAWIAGTRGDDATGNAGRVFTASRPASCDFDIKVIAVDTFTGAEGSATTQVTVKDVDQMPTVPTQVTMDPETDAVRDTKLSATAAGATDADGDEISYSYQWHYSVDGTTWTKIKEDTAVAINTPATYAEDADVHEIVKKGNKVRVIAGAYTKIYNGEDERVVENFIRESEVTTIWSIGNTAPEFVAVGNEVIVDTKEVYELTVQEDPEEALTVQLDARDVDKIDGVDSLKYSVSSLDEAYGTIAIDENGLLSYKPAKNYYNDGENMPVVTVTVTDESDATDTVVIQLYVEGVNDQPVIKAADQYVLPDERGQEKTATFAVDMGEFEDGQEIAAAEITDSSDPDGIFDGKPELTYEGTTLTLTYTVKADAELGKSATVTFKAMDNGGIASSKVNQAIEGKVTDLPALPFNFDATRAAEPEGLWSEEVTVTIFVGASPWYPIISFECNADGHKDGHTFHLVGTDNSVYELTVKGDKRQLLPADYAAAGVPGYTDDVTVTATIYVWTMEEGTTDEVCEKKELTVSAYGKPGEASAEGDAEVSDDGWVTLPTITVPMAQSYILEVVDGNGNVVQTIAGDFQADANGMILPNIEAQQLQIAKAGDYSVTVTGINPNGEGEAAAEVVKFTVEEDTKTVVEWTEGDFLPADGKVLTTDIVKLSWPAATNAQSYTVRVYGPDGALLEEATNLTETSYNTTKTTAGKTPENYSWYVSAIRNGEAALSSDFQNFTLSETTKDIIPEVVTAAGQYDLRVSYEGALADSDKLTVDCLYYSCAKNFWYDNLGLKADSTSEDGAFYVTIRNTEVSVGDFVVLVIYINGKQVGSDVAYMVMP